MTNPLLQALSTAPPVQMLTAQISSVNADNTVTLDYQGGEIPGVVRLTSYPTPTPGDVVFVLSTSSGGMVVLGAELTRILPPAPPAAAAPTVLTPTGQGTYDRTTQTWATGALLQDATHDAAYLYDSAALAALPTSVQAVEVQLRTPFGAGPVNLVLISNPALSGTFTPVSPPHLVALPENVLTWARLPLSWLTALAAGTATGVGMSSDTDTVQITDGGTLRVTPLQ